MVGKIKPKFTAQALRNMLNGKLEIVKKAFFTYLQAIGEEFVKNARLKADFTDRTGNLRNSIGYIIMLDGKQLVSNFTNTSKGDGSETEKDGKAIGMAKAEEISAKFPSGYSLICVAGMDYAAAVESKGFDVISTSSIVAKQSLIVAIESVHKKMNRA